MSEYVVCFKVEEEVNVIDDTGNSPNVMKGAPEIRRQVEQWQFVREVGQ